jgi:hypothetical protein
MRLPPGVAEALAQLPLPEHMANLTWEEIEAGLIERGASEGEASVTVRELAETGLTPGLAMWCIA